MKKHPPAISVGRARALRRNPTDAEQVMWRLLCECLPEGRWRRQVPIRHYIVDFASHRLKIVIELDGGQHGTAADLKRTCTIEAEGYRMVRFWNNDVLENGAGCLLKLRELVRSDHPNPTSTRRHAAKSAYPSPIEGEGN